MARPRTLLAFIGALKPVLFRDELEARLHAVCDLVAETPVRVDDPASAELLGEAEVLITGWGTGALGADVLDRMPNLRLVAHAAGTVKEMITPELWARGVRVSSAAAANAVPVAEFTIAAIVLAAKGAFWANNAAHQGSAGLEAAAVADSGFHRRRVGVIGASHIGRLVLDRLRGFDVDVLLSDPTLDDAAARGLGATLVPLDELLQSADVVSLHAPLLPSTERMIGAAELARIRDGATFINTARGQLVDSPALDAELVSGRIRAVIDTYWPEPLPADSPLRGLYNVFLTPHLAGSRGREVERMSEFAIDEVERFLRGEALLGEVTEADMGRIA